MSISGRDKHLKRLRFMANGARGVVKEVLFSGADMIKAEAHHSITAGAVSGKNHVPSRPGQAPNDDTGHLRSQIETAMPRNDVATVTSNAAYAADLEFGTSKMEARPYMRPARDKLKPRIQKLFRDKMRKLNKGQP